MRPVTLRAEFEDQASAERVRGQLVERGYEAGITVILSVTTVGYLAPEVEGLVWLGGGSIAKVPESRSRRSHRSA